MAANDYNTDSKSVVDVTTDREAHPKHWYAAKVRSCCEKKTAAQINALGIETYVPTQTEIRQWSDRKKKIERILLPMYVLIRGTEAEAQQVKRLSTVYTLLEAPGKNTPAVIPDDQITRLQFMVGNSTTPIQIQPLSLQKGDPVRVVRGSLKGLEGYVAKDSDGQSRISIFIDFLGCASVEIPVEDLETILN